MERGVVSLFGVKSALFVAMNSKGRLYTTVSSSGQGKLQAARGLRITQLKKIMQNLEEGRQYLSRMGRGVAVEGAGASEGLIPS